jgi:hypothetical protein
MFHFLCGTRIRNTKLIEEVGELNTPPTMTGGNMATGRGICARSRPYSTVHGSRVA